MPIFRRIVAAVDFSDTSREVLSYASALARESEGDVHALHVVPDPLHQPWTIEATGVDWAKMQEQWTIDATRRLTALITAECPAPLSVTPIVILDAPAAGIVRYAGELPADVIVLGTHGYGPVKRFLLGSVVERVLRQATCPVLTVPHGALGPPEAKAR